MGIYDNPVVRAGRGWRPPGYKPLVPTKKPPSGIFKGKPTKPKPSNKAGLYKTNVGFDPMTIAQQLAALEYNDTITALQNKRKLTMSSMDEALEDLKAWAAGQEKARYMGEQQVTQATQQAVNQQKENDAQIAALFGEQAMPEAAYTMRPGEDIVSAAGLVNQNFMAGMKPVLSMTAREMQRDERKAYMDEVQGIDSELATAQKNKRAAVGKNYLDAIQLAWSREKDLEDRKLAKDAADLARQTAEASIAATRAGVAATKAQTGATKAETEMAKKLLPGQLRKQALEAAASKTELKALKLQNQNARLKNKAAALELRKIRQQAAVKGGLDWSKPDTGQYIAGVTFKGMIGPGAHGFTINPQLALAAAMDRVKMAGWDTSDPRVIGAVLNFYNSALRNSHAHGRYKKYQPMPTTFNTKD